MKCLGHAALRKISFLTLMPTAPKIFYKSCEALNHFFVHKSKDIKATIINKPMCFPTAKLL